MTSPVYDSTGILRYAFMALPCEGAGKTFLARMNRMRDLQSQLPDMIERKRERGQTDFIVLTPRCGTGEDTYSAAMLFRREMRRLAPEMTLRVIGTDDSMESLVQAANGVFAAVQMADLARHGFATDWRHGSGEIRDFVKAGAELREVVRFYETQMLLELAQVDPLECDVIWFGDDPNAPDHHAESMQWLTTLHPWGVSNWNGRGAAAARSTVRVVCIDGSASTHALLGKILDRENGFEVVGVARDANEAHELVRTLAPDVVTLDLHLPIVNGVEYLKTHCDPTHPPVVVISRVTEPELNFAFEAVCAGALEVLEKPAVSSLRKQADAIRAALRRALVARIHDAGVESSRTLSGVSTVTLPERKVCVLRGALRDRQKMYERFARGFGVQPPTYVRLQGSERFLPLLAQEARDVTHRLGVTGDQVRTKPLPDTIVFVESESELLEKLRLHAEDRILECDLSEAVDSAFPNFHS